MMKIEGQVDAWAVPVGKSEIGITTQQNFETKVKLIRNLEWEGKKGNGVGDGRWGLIEGKKKETSLIISFNFRYFYIPAELVKICPSVCRHTR
jgi:hypothetical protein